MSSLLEIYDDKELKKKVETLDLGEIEVGTTVKKIYYIKNTTGGTITRLEFKIDSPYIKVVRAPKLLKPDEVGELELEIKPPLDIRKGLNTKVEISFRVIYS